MNNQIRIGYEIAKRRIALGVSQEKLAELIGISRVSVVRIENGDQIPKADTIAMICEALGIAPNDLYPKETVRKLKKNGAENAAHELSTIDKSPTAAII